MFSNLLVRTACFGRDQQLHQHHQGAGRAPSHRDTPGNSHISLQSRHCCIRSYSWQPHTNFHSRSFGHLKKSFGYPGQAEYKHTQTRGLLLLLLLQLFGHVCKFCSSAHASLELLGHQWGEPAQTSLFLGNIQAVSSGFAHPKEAQGAGAHPKADNGNPPSQLALLPATGAGWEPHKCQPQSSPGAHPLQGCVGRRLPAANRAALPFMGSMAGNKGWWGKENWLGKLAKAQT